MKKETKIAIVIGLILLIIAAIVVYFMMQKKPVVTTTKTTSGISGLLQGGGLMGLFGGKQKPAMTPSEYDIMAKGEGDGWASL